jgi:hypothetical protein
MSKWRTWFNDLQAQGKMKSGLRTHERRQVVHGTGGRFVTDGPFAESRRRWADTLISVASLEEAVVVADNARDSSMARW